MGKAVSATDTSQQNASCGIFQKGCGLPGKEVRTPEPETDSIVSGNGKQLMRWPHRQPENRCSEQPGDRVCDLLGRSLGELLGKQPCEQSGAQNDAQPEHELSPGKSHSIFLSLC